MTFFVNLRYLFLLNINLQKVAFSKNRETENSIDKIPIQYRIYKKLSSPTALAILFLCSFLFLFFCQLLVIGGLRFECKSPATDIMRYVYAIPLIVMLILNTSALFIDIVRNWRILIKCNFYRYFVYSDPNFFRIEEFGIFLFAFLLLAWAVFGNIPIPFRLTLTEFLLFYNLHIGGIFSLYIAIFFHIYYRFKSRKKIPAAKLDFIFENEVLLKLFSNYANSGIY
jgi:hypothetical protein